ncbi:hypothetical protein AZH53_04190 [Methanomicrobiaceae archaeon CYW5]|uniref:GNAT family N-acetyltransferase n=1 Tax=Methanovulcanius yangii TaxID=1789227 RepID=UPI0029CAAB46|nr:GNAT family N-acetyltransferase [Methanovulcanius yangii]MBT8507618.1 hypothetical protein [Methanovulcanius yangii]
MKVQLYRADAGDAAEWNRIADESPQGTIFHSWHWLNIAASYSGCALHPLIGYVKNDPVGLFPLFARKQFGVNFVFSPPPHTALLYLGPTLLSDALPLQSRREKVNSSFLDEVNGYISMELKAQYTQLFLPPKFSDPRPFTWSGYTVRPEYNYVSDLSPGAESLYESLPKKKKQDIQRARKRGITVEMGGKAELNAIYDLMVERYREQGRLVHVPREYLFEIFQTFPENLKIFVTYFEGDIVTGLIDIHDRNSLLSWIGNPKPMISISPSPNDLLQWEEIQYCCAEGITSYVTMGAAGNERLHTYYSSKFNPHLDVRFSAKKCSRFIKGLEYAYVHACKPARSFLNKS